MVGKLVESLLAVQTACLAQFSGLSEVVSRKWLWGVSAGVSRTPVTKAGSAILASNAGIALSRNVSTMISTMSSTGLSASTWSGYEDAFGSRCDRLLMYQRPSWRAR